MAFLTPCSILLSILGTANAASVVLWATTSDGWTEEDPTRSCFVDTRVTAFGDGQPGGAEDYFKVATTKWHSSGLQFGCLQKDASWNCIASCFDNGANPTFSTYGYLTFLAKVEGDFSPVGCQPTVGLGKRWPMYASNNIQLNGAYVQHGELSDTEFRQVVIPIQDFATLEWPDLSDVKTLTFKSCGTAYSFAATYKITDVQLTDDPPPLLETGAPSPVPSVHVGPWITNIWNSADDSHTVEDVATSCLTHGEAYITTTSAHDDIFFDGLHDYFTASPDKYRSVGVMLGCQGKDANWVCNKSCMPWDGTNPDFTEGYLTFLAKVEGTFTDTCKPAVGFTGGGWPRLSSNNVVMEHEYVDFGKLVSDEWRRVVIPLADFKTPDWDMSSIYAMYFQTCGMEHVGSQPSYHVTQVQIWDVQPELIAPPPTIAPTVQVTESPQLATHRMVHHHWYPLLGEIHDSSTWYYVSGGTWPSIPTEAPDQSIVVVIPMGESVSFSSYDETKYDKVIVYGSLTIVPNGVDVLLRPGTLVVEMMGTLVIETLEMSETVTIEIDAALDRDADPQETMVGIISLGGNIRVHGNESSKKMAKLITTASVNTMQLVVEGDVGDWSTGDEIILPDTQEGLDVGHWNFPNNEPNGYTDQTEIHSIASVVSDSNGNSIITLATPVSYEHTANAHAGHITRSIKFVTSPTSSDRGHILFTGMGSMEFRNARIEEFGRTTIELIDDTTIEESSELHFAEGLAHMSVVHQGTNQLARYPFHAHHSSIESYFQGSVILNSPRNGCVPHNSRMHVTDNIIIGAAGSGVFLEGAVETGPVEGNFFVGTGKGTRGGDDGRFSTQAGEDMGHGGFGVWARGVYSKIQNNHAEGHFGRAPFAYFVHPSFVEHIRVPDVPGTPDFLVGKTRQEVAHAFAHDFDPPTSLTIQTFGAFVNNTARGTWGIGLDVSYFGSTVGVPEGNLIENFELEALAYSGSGMHTTHSSTFTLRGGSMRGAVEGNAIVGIFCNNGGLEIFYNESDIINVALIRGGNC
eukprot:CAMPEP_0198285446 /NCGR_PEP_ID=MMETSP1449-20131203/4720_1 /TAXON_ID=420275 /ORGANISM="Attheya septentrionalis, Strain CCMP2084" /LENGTH=1026 /DNA_ID=CAMNT_0043982855 /DNA_START=46 /DNA_END=3126 /DNA_ORIENTATION=+